MDNPPPVLKDWIERELGTPWMVHRLDRGTSGAIIVARNADAHRGLGRCFQDRKVAKSYLALVLGRPAMPHITVKIPLEGKAAFSEIQRLQTWRLEAASVSEVRVDLRTGRQHQARRHLFESGTPVLGDRMYGGVLAVEIFLIPRLLLHAERLEIAEYGVSVTAALDEDYLRCRSHFLERALVKDSRSSGQAT